MTNLHMRIVAVLLMSGAFACDAQPADDGPEADHALQEAAADRTESDGRVALRLPPAARQQVLLEMRTMMAALQGMLSAMGAEDSAAFAAAAEGGGVGVAVDREESLAGMLPKEFATLGMSTHAHFDELADRARVGASFDSLATVMGALIEKCNACHASYRIEVEAVR